MQRHNTGETSMADHEDFFEREGKKLKDRDELYHEEKPITFTAKPEKWGIYFNGENGEPVGRLEFDSHGALDFTGNATQAAEIFFGCVVEQNSEVLNDMRELAKLGYAVVKDFLPNVSECALQDYGALNDFMIKAKEKFGD